MSYTKQDLRSLPEMQEEVGQSGKQYLDPLLATPALLSVSPIE